MRGHSEACSVLCECGRGWAEIWQPTQPNELSFDDAEKRTE